MSFTSHYATCSGREIHYTQWGAQHENTVMAWHGLARTGRDMDERADHLSKQGYRVICPDMIGRGLSQWSTDPKHEYCLAFYARIARELIDLLAIDKLHWVGTSMGGAILVLRDTTDAMQLRGSGLKRMLQVVEIPGCGHAPALNVPEHFQLIEKLIATNSQSSL